MKQDIPAFGYCAEREEEGVGEGEEKIPLASTSDESIIS